MGRILPEVLDMQQNYSRLPERYCKYSESQIANIILTLLEDTC